MILLLLVGVGLILYPSIADAWNRHVSSKAVAGYVEAVENMSTEERDAQLAKANAYNAALVGRGTSRFIPTDAEHEEYESILDVTGTGIMGYVTIPKISVRVPIYHGTSDTVLQIAAGHLEGSSLPVGGPSTHAAISGHTGLPSALLFTGLDRLKEGDTFTITVFDEVLTYEVSEINVVEPTDVSDLEIKEGEDLVSLITCTPYGVNSHRLIVTGHRIPTPTADDADPGIDQALVKDIAMIVAALVIIGGTVAAIFLRRHFRLKKAAEAAAGLTGGGKHAARK
ncbi:class C sortase [Bifidobacterium sp. BRDM6]|uniref:Class C sortase n=2 Tax=Bifidobacterium choloepi TaxID=2614131 RepID=A0A6I5NGI4_9BIFI|nr:class C sortase [Bifidobacterium choloepi]